MEGNIGIPVAMEVDPSGQGSLSSCFFDPRWDNSISMEQIDPFDSTRSSIVSSPVASSLGAGEGDGGMIKELIGRLGVISSGSSGHVSPQPFLGHMSTNNSTNASSFTTPLNSPPKLSLSTMGHRIRGSFPPLSEDCLVPFATDPGFAERAARFSSLGSRDFAVGLDGKNARVSSSIVEGGDSWEGSSLSEQVHGGETGNVKKTQHVDVSAKKRKLVQRGKLDAVTPKGSEVSGGNNHTSTKKIKSCQAAEKEGSGKKPDEREAMAAREEKMQKHGKDSHSKQQEPPKDYIHVRARRGQATDSHSLAERVRREKISQRMKALQDLVPGCNKITGKALMLDEIINYVQSLQRQVEFLSMKLSTLNPRMDINMEAFLRKDIFQSRESILPTDSSPAHVFPYGLLPSHGTIAAISPVQLPENLLDAATTPIHRSPTIHFPHIEGFSTVPSQVLGVWEDDLQTVVQMGIAPNLQPISFHLGAGSTEPNHGQMKVES
ncbi:hypothetical protein SAY87_004441 [Trapa incisa]|uniref:BHLH domain-containing protein n=1 Tax=Trapa incisa TaxID=236973 RepID=A0AAN7JNX6_9MYRT|nr:hypothetical protein SAY87_004441 [Trapa incisa]